MDVFWVCRKSVLTRASVIQMLEKPKCVSDSEWYGMGLQVSDEGQSWGHLGGVPDGTHSLAFRDQSGLTWIVLFSEAESGMPTSEIELNTMMRHALSVTSTFAAYSTLLFKDISFLSMNVPFYSMYSSNMSEVYEILLPYDLIEGHYMTLKQGGYFMHHIDLFNMNEQVYANIVWFRNEGNPDWFIRQHEASTSNGLKFDAEVKSVTDILSSGYKIHSVASCGTQEIFKNVTIFIKKTDQNRALCQKYSLAEITSYRMMSRVVCGLTNKVILVSVCFCGGVKLLTIVSESGGVEGRVPNQYFFSASVKVFIQTIQKDPQESPLGLRHVQFYSNYYSQNVFVCFVRSPDVEPILACDLGLSRYALMKKLTSLAKSVEVKVDKICAYVCEGKVLFAYATKVRKMSCCSMETFEY